MKLEDRRKLSRKSYKNIYFFTSQSKAINVFYYFILLHVIVAFLNFLQFFLVKKIIWIYYILYLTSIYLNSNKIIFIYCKSMVLPYFHKSITMHFLSMYIQRVISTIISNVYKCYFWLQFYAFYYTYILLRLIWIVCNYMHACFL